MAVMTKNRNIKILIVDDINLNRQYLAMVLSALKGIEIVGEAENGQDAIDKVGKLPPDIVSMDVQLPIMDGFQASSQIKKLFPEIIAVACS
jgi:YesN/AraC family two-component response regulator